MQSYTFPEKLAPRELKLLNKNICIPILKAPSSEVSGYSIHSVPSKQGKNSTLIQRVEQRIHFRLVSGIPLKHHWKSLVYFLHSENIRKLSWCYPSDISDIAHPRTKLPNPSSFQCICMETGFSVMGFHGVEHTQGRSCGKQGKKKKRSDLTC